MEICLALAPLHPNFSPSKEPPQIEESIPHNHPPKKKVSWPEKKNEKKKKTNLSLKISPPANNQYHNGDTQKRRS
jgi:hypothetical protein